MDDAQTARLVEFEETGYVVLPGALTEAETGFLRAAIDRDRAAQPQAWSLQGQERRVGYVPGDGDRRPEQRTGDGVGEIGESGRWASGNLLERSDAFDGFVAHRSVLGLCRALLGPTTMCLNGLSATVREAVAAPPPPDRNSHWSLFHRENAASILPTHPRCILSLMVQFYLNDCDETTHCFSVVPESVAQKRSLPLRPHPILDWAGSEVQMVDDEFSAVMWRNVEREDDAVHIHAPAGTAIVVNSSNIHAGTVRQTPTPRYTLRVDYGHSSAKWGGGRVHAMGAEVVARLEGVAPAWLLGAAKTQPRL